MVFIHHEETGSTTVVTTCPCCQRDYTLEVPTEGFIKWQLREEYIQVALPELSDADRERLISGMCPDCWDRVFGDEDT